ncbi:shufflon system plasmid conjugative transfer pilus tip adhesin PilV [Paraburkholderia fungorum]|uniref:shufflon system plasmid conjugative transfer pilus tip adhesin PilV n=1 Tax=Paraburkholderia fungorum TaxID=134537 RepID=UPI00402B36B0
MDDGGTKMIFNRHNMRLHRQRGVISIEAAVVSALVGMTLVGVGGWVKYDADFKNDRAAADNLALVLQGAQSYFNANTATIAAAATPTVSYGWNTWKGSVSSAVSATNIYGQSYTMSVFKESNGQLDMVVTTSGGSAIPDGSLLRISKMMGGAGGYILRTSPTIVQNGAAGWSQPIANFGVNPGGGHIAAAAFFANAAQANDYLYRHQVAGHPELNQMSTTLDMTHNNIANAATVAASAVAVTAAAGGTAVVSLNNSQLLDNNNNLFVRANGTVYVQNVAGSAWAPMATGSLTQYGNEAVYGNRYTAGSDQVDGSSQVNGNSTVLNSSTVGGNSQVNGSAQVNGNAQVNGAITTYGNVNLMTNGASVYSPNTMYVSAAANLYLNPFGGNRVIVGGGGGNGQFETTGRLYADEYIQPQGGVSLGGGCGPNGLIGNSGSGPAFCVNGQWTAPSSFSPRAYGTAAPDSGTIGPYNWCFANNITVGESSAYGVWGVQLVADYGNNNRYFRAYNSKQGGQVFYVCF